METESHLHSEQIFHVVLLVHWTVALLGGCLTYFLFFLKPVPPSIAIMGILRK